MKTKLNLDIESLYDTGWPIGTIWIKDEPEVMTNDGWLKLSGINYEDLSSLGVLGKLTSGIDEHGRKVAEGQRILKRHQNEIDKQWIRLFGRPKSWYCYGG
jgi:hypothetical protein